MSPSHRNPTATVPSSTAQWHALSPAGKGQAGASRIVARPAVLAAAMIAGFLVLRLGLMLAIGFGNDEAYTLAGARMLQLSYFDHPPLHIWIAHLAMLVFGETRWVRLPFVLLFGGTTWLLFLVTRELYGARAGVWAVLFVNLSIFFTVSAGGWIVPDGVLVFCLLAAVLALLPVLRSPAQPGPSPWRAWIQAGLWFGLAGLSKYNAVLIALGLAAFIVGSPRHRRRLAHPAPHCGALVALAILTPVLAWNARHGWVSFAFQTSRALPQSALHPTQLLTMLLGETAMLAPWVAIPLVAALASACCSPRGDADRLLLALSLPAIALFSVAPLWSARGLPHWPMPGWLFAFPLLGAWIEGRSPRWFAPVRWAAGSTVAFAVVLLVGVGLTAEGWASRGVAAARAGMDPTLETLDWTALRDDASIAAAHPAFVVTRRWMDAGKIAMALGKDVQVAVFSDDPRQFAFGPPIDRFVGQDAVIILPMGQLADGLPRLEPYFARLDALESLWIGRRGRHEVELAVIRAHVLLRPYPLPYPERASPAIAAGGPPRSGS